MGTLVAMATPFSLGFAPKVNRVCESGMEWSEDHLLQRRVTDGVSVLSMIYMYVYPPIETEKQRKSFLNAAKSLVNKFSVVCAVECTQTMLCSLPHWKPPYKILPLHSGFSHPIMHRTT